MLLDLLRQVKDKDSPLLHVMAAKAINMKTGIRITYNQGVPGCGKTTLQAVMYALEAECLSDLQVLSTTHTNRSCQELALNLSDVDRLPEDKRFDVNAALQSKMARILAFTEDKRSTPIDIMSDEKQKLVKNQHIIISTARTALNDYQFVWSSLRRFEFDFWNVDEGQQLGTSDDIALASHVVDKSPGVHVLISGDGNQVVGGADVNNPHQQAMMRKLTEGDGTLRCKSLRFLTAPYWTAEVVQILEGYESRERFPHDATDNLAILAHRLTTQSVWPTCSTHSVASGRECVFPSVFCDKSYRNPAAAYVPVMTGYPALLGK